MADEAEVHGLVALMELQASRGVRDRPVGQPYCLPTRTGASGTAS